MDVLKICKLFQGHVEYTGEETAIVKSDPIKVKSVTETPEFVKRRVIANVIESRGCRARHHVEELR